ncbi:MAG: ATP-binding cassette domain-containing protein [Spirochaetales bacterium]|nr:ATP-binding cassette domain-containing protein [Spirochaetales bacterium]
MKTTQLVHINNLQFTFEGTALLNIPSFFILKGATLGILGANGSGKSLLAGILAGEIPGKGREKRYGVNLSGDLQIDGDVELVSFREQALIMEREKYYDDTEFMQGKKDPGRTVKLFVCGAPAGASSLGAKSYQIPDNLSLEADKLIDRFGLTTKSNRGLRYLSTGEFRKTLLCRSLLDMPDLLILDDPFSGLDKEAVADLNQILKDFHGELSILLLSGKISDIPEWSDGLAIVSEGVLSGTAGFIEGKELWEQIVSTESGHLSFTGEPIAPDIIAKTDRKPIIEMNRVDVSYLTEPILKDLNWRVLENDHWQIAGPNGAGKSTLLSLITGDNPKAFGQDISLFGRKKGSGESVWEIKQKIGFVSGAFHLGFLKGPSILEVILSGYFDSVGLYEKPDPVQIEHALTWCARLDLGGWEDRSFKDISFGLQRSVLISRAMIKAPELLILDEPCQGLDDAHTSQVLKTIEWVGNSGLSTILYVSHRTEQEVSSIRNILSLVPHPEGGFTGEIDRRM